MDNFFGKNLKYLRINNNLTQDDLANILKINRSNISRIENDEVNTSIFIAYKISNYFNIDIDKLIKEDLSNQ